MKIESISLAWFRGAADKISLDLGGKSFVVYGPNGAGKSCMVDSVEYVTNDSKIGHLSHEYSGRRQEKGLTNTKATSDKKAALEIKLADNSSLRIEIERNGTTNISGTPSDDPRTWNYRRTILRQDEVAEFIKDSKTEKYSALLPLLGLDRLEVAAENVRQLTKTVRERSELTAKRASIQRANAKRTVVEKNGPLTNQINDLYQRYCGNATAMGDDIRDNCNRINAALETCVAESRTDERRYIAIREVGAISIKEDIEQIRSFNGKLAATIEPLVEERLGVLENTSTFIGKHKPAQNIVCPACGRTIAQEIFLEHVKSEEGRLQEIRQTFAERKILITSLSRSIHSLQASLKKPDLKDWRGSLVSGSLADNLAYLDNCDTNNLAGGCGDEGLTALSEQLNAIIDIARMASAMAPVDTQQLANDKAAIDTIIEITSATPMESKVQEAEVLLKLLEETERSIRDEIHSKAESVIKSISSDIQNLWSILHPDVLIEDVCLSVPASADKAIDIHLKFYGDEQESPRLTLSEGYRNSLGLCIFLAMVKHEGRPDRPLFLDDVVVSLDRNHRGMIAELLEREFSQYQIVVFTHDREWYTELAHLLDGKRWQLKMLLPYNKPEDGIRWSHKTTTFDEARAHLDNRPDSAANDARKIMDVELALFAERLELKLPFVRGDKNDHRMAHEFLEAILKAAKLSFQQKEEGTYRVYNGALEALEKADSHVLAWANRGSHTFSVTKSEATKLIDICEEAINLFKCRSCKKNLWYLTNDKLMQCECGEIRWRF